MTRLYDVNGNIFAILKAKLESEAVVQSCYIKKVFLEISQNSHENTCEFCEIPKNAFSYRTPPVAASVSYKFP